MTCRRRWTRPASARGIVLVGAMHITAAVWINDDEPGLHEDTLEWLDKVAPPSWKEPANDVARQLLPDPGDYRHHRGGEDNGDAHLKNLLVHHQVIVPVTDGRLDLGPLAAGLLLRVRRRAAQADDHQGAWGVTGVRASARRPGRRAGCPRPCRPSARGWRRSRSPRAAPPGGSGRRAAGDRRGAARDPSRRAPRPPARRRAARARARPCRRSAREPCSRGRRWASSAAARRRRSVRASPG